MKKLLFTLSLFCMPGTVHAVEKIDPGTIPDSCLDHFCITNPTRTAHCSLECNGCQGTTTITNKVSGVVTKTTKKTVYDPCPSQTGQTIDCNCVVTNTYSCAAGYYGRPTSSTSGCISCTTATGNAKATSNAGATAITDCYLPAGTVATDTTGTYKITGGNCEYSL